MRYFGQLDRIMVTMNGGGKEEQRNINAMKGRSLTIVVFWEVVVQTVQEESREKKSKKVCKEEKRRVRLTRPGNQYVVLDQASRDEVHREYCVRSPKGN